MSLTNLRQRNDRGSLELSAIMSIVVLTLVILGIAGGIGIYLTVSSNASLQDQASNAAASVFEESFATAWSDLGHVTDDADLTDPRVQALAGGAPVVVQDAASFTIREPVAPVRTGETENRGTWNQNFTVLTVVTWENEPALTESGVHTANFGTKRITTQVIWGEGDNDSQTFTTTRTPTIAEAVPSNIQVVAGGGLDIERNVFDPVLEADFETGVLDASIFRAYGYEIQVSNSAAFDSYDVLVSGDEHGVVTPCSGEFSEVRESFETSCTYNYMSQYGLTPSFRVMARTLDTDNVNASSDGIKYSNVISFPGLDVPNLNGTKVLWNRDRVIWSPVLGLLGAPNVEVVVHRGDTEMHREAYSGTSTGQVEFDTGPNQSRQYRVCIEIDGTEQACSTNYLLRTIAAPGAPLDLDGELDSGSQAEFTWQDPDGVEFFNGPGGIGLSYDVQRLNQGSWQTVASGLTERRMTVSAPSVGSGFVDNEVSVRVRAVNNAGAGPWSDPAVATLGGPPTAPSISLQSMVTRSSGSDLVDVTWTWTAGLRAQSWEWEYRNAANNSVISSGTVTSGNPRTFTAGATYGTSRDFRVRSVNQFGRSAWVTNNVQVGAAPTGTLSISQSTPGFNSVFVEWNTVPGAEGFEFEYRRNMDCSASGNSNLFSWSTNNAAQRSVTFAANINGGDCFRVRGRAVNQYGAGPWSGWTGTIYASVSALNSNWGINATPTTSGATWNSTNASCPGTTRPIYRIRTIQFDTSWGSYSAWGNWGAGSVRSWSFSHGNRGSMNWQGRCENPHTGRVGVIVDSSNFAHTHRLVNTSGSSWDNEHRRRLAQVTGSPVATYGTGNHFSRFAPNTTLWSDYSADLQTRIMARTGQWVVSHSGTARDGLWGDRTTNGLIRLASVMCGNWVRDGTGVSITNHGTTSWNGTVKNRVTRCMNEENFFGNW